MLHQEIFKYVVIMVTSSAVRDDYNHYTYNCGNLNFNTINYEHQTKDIYDFTDYLIHLNRICNSKQWNECWKDVFGKIGVGSFLSDKHHVGKHERHHVAIGTFAAEARKHALHVNTLRDTHTNHEIISSYIHTIKVKNAMHFSHFTVK